MPANAVHERYITLLLNQAMKQEHPSHQFLDRIEATITDRRDAEAYVEVLMDKSEQWDHPSLRILDRVARFVHLMAVADHLEAHSEELGLDA
jgi:hypothetical protein